MDPELDAFLNLELPLADVSEEPDAFDEFIEAQKLAGKTGWSGAENVADAIKKIKSTRHDTTPAPQNDSRLEKREETISFYVNWLGEQMEKTSKPSDEIIAQWRSDFPDARAEIVDAIEAAQLIVDGE